MRLIDFANATMSSFTSTFKPIYSKVKTLPLDGILPSPKPLGNYGAYLADFVHRRGIRLNVLSERAGMNYDSLRRYLNGGVVRPDRNKLLRLSRLLRMDEKETRELLRRAKLSPCNRGDARDKIIFDCIKRDVDAYDVDELLTENGHDGLFDAIGDGPDLPLGKYARKFQQSCGKSPEDVAKEAGISKQHLYRVVNGDISVPKRDTLIRLACAMDMSHDEAQDFLELGHHARLDRNDPRDFCIYYGIANRQSIAEINASLMEHGHSGI